MFTSVFNERFRSNPLCDFRLGTVATSDYETPLTGYEPKKDLNLVNTEELDLAATSDVYRQHTLDDDASLNDPDVDDNQLAKYLAVVVDSTGKPVEMRSNNDPFSCDTRNLKSAQNQFLLVTQPEMICQTGGSVQARIAEERESSQAQIRTMLDEQRRTIIAEYSEKVLHHDLLAAHAEQDRKVLQEELLRQQQEFREVHQQDLMKHLELQKFQNSAFDEFTQKKFIEDQKTIMELSGRLQELQNEVNFMNDSKDFMDAESICSGNPHVTSPPGLFPRHPPFVGMLKPIARLMNWLPAARLGMRWTQVMSTLTGRWGKATDRSIALRQSCPGSCSSDTRSQRLRHLVIGRHPITGAWLLHATHPL